MLNQEHKLYFPFILYVRPHATNTFGVYKLNWITQEIVFRSKIENCISTLPFDYEHKIADLVFGLQTGYLTEIRRCAHAAINEFNVHRQVDGYMQDLCLKPGVSYVETAFRLLADSILDEHSDYYTRAYVLKTIAFHAMLYKFWCCQTTKTSIYENARLYDLAQASRTAQKIKHPGYDLDKSTEEISKFLEAIKNHQKVFEESKRCLKRKQK